MSSPEGILIVGAPRSGTTLIRRLLNAHPDIACPAETYLLSAASRFLHSEAFGDGLAVGVESGLAYSGVESDEIVGRLRDFVFGFLREIRDREGASRWAEKTAFGAFHLDEIDRVCADECQYVCVYRHGADVACSTEELVTKMETVVSELRPYTTRYSRPLVAYANAWLDVVARMQRLEAERPGRTIAIRYEDLVENPGAQLERLVEFLELPTDVEKMLARAFESPETPGLGDWKTYQTSKVQTASVGRWRSISGESQRILAELCNPTLETLGYEPMDAPEASSDEESRHRLQLGLMVARMRAAADTEPGDS